MCMNKSSYPHYLIENGNFPSFYMFHGSRGSCVTSRIGNQIVRDGGQGGAPLILLSISGGGKIKLARPLARVCVCAALVKHIQTFSFFFFLFLYMSPKSSRFLLELPIRDGKLLEKKNRKWFCKQWGHVTGGRPNKKSAFALTLSFTHSHYDGTSSIGLMTLPVKQESVTRSTEGALKR